MLELFRGRTELQKHGPRLQVVIDRPLLGRSASRIPDHNRPVEALIDTGVARSVINPELAASLGLLQFDTIDMSHVGGIALVPVYAASISFPGSDLTSVIALEIIGAKLPSQPVSCL